MLSVALVNVDSYENSTHSRRGLTNISNVYDYDFSRNNETASVFLNNDTRAEGNNGRDGWLDVSFAKGTGRGKVNHRRDVDESAYTSKATTESGGILKGST